MVSLGVSTLCFMLPWQFAQFVLLTQVNGEQSRGFWEGKTFLNLQHFDSGREKIRLLRAVCANSSSIIHNQCDRFIHPSSVRCRGQNASFKFNFSY